MIQHRQVHIEYGARQAEVDEGLGPLVLELWKANLATVLSCEEVNPGLAWLKFATPGEAKAFLRIAGAGSPQVIDELPELPEHQLASKSRRRLWSYHVHPRCTVSLHAPMASLAIALARLKAFNRSVARTGRDVSK